MQLSEKEIEGMVATAVAKCFVYALGNTEGLEGKTRNVVKQAAHAIAEKMAEGVVWTKLVELNRLDDRRALMYGVGSEKQLYTEQGEYYGELNEIDALELHGQLVTVTVSKKEEGDVQGNNS